MEIVLHYIGDGSFLVGLPTGDISSDELQASGYSLEEILASGLYTQA